MRMAKLSQDLVAFRLRQLEELAGLVTSGRLVPKLLDLSDLPVGRIAVELEAAGEGKERDEAEVVLHGIVERIEEAARLDREALRLEERLSALVGGG